MPRLFTGLEIPEDVAERLALFRGGLIGARWIDTDNYQITLRFIGDIDERTAWDIEETLGNIRKRIFSVKVLGLSAFGGDRPHSLVALIQPSPELLALQTEQERLMQRIGLNPEGRRYTPHIALARLRGTRPVEVADYISTRSFPQTIEFQVGQFVLFSSRSSSGGGPYIVEAGYPLQMSA